MNKEIKATTKFRSQIILESSMYPNPTSLGMANNEMELQRDENSDYGNIIWSVEYDNGDFDEVVIGLWFTENKVTDYDGVFDIPQQGKDLLIKQGFDLSEII